MAVPLDLPGEVMPRRPWDEVSMHLAVTIDPRVRAVSGVVTHEVAPLGGVDAEVRFHAVGLTIDKVTVDGKDTTAWRQADEWIDVTVDDPRTSHTIAIAYHGSPELGLHFRTPPSDASAEAWSQGEDIENRYWYPAWDFPNDRFVYSGAITAPDGFVAITNGAFTGKAPATGAAGKGQTTWSYALDARIPNYLVAVAVGDYAVTTDTVDTKGGAVPLEYVAPRSVPPDDVTRTFGLVKGPLAWYAEVLGPYPWPNNRQIAVQRFLWVAMENPTVAIFDTTLLLEDDVPRTTYNENVVAHELAHHWFGDSLTTYGWRDLWLNEGFAEYWAGRWIQQAHGDDEFASYARSWREEALRDDTPLAPNAWTIGDGPENGSVYDRGAMVLHLLATYLGDDVFQAATRAYVRENTDRMVETDDLRRAFEDASGEHLGWLFDEYVRGGGAPKITVDSAWLAGDLTVTFTQEPREDGAEFTVPVDVEIGGGEVLTKRVWVGPGTSRLVVPLSLAPGWVVADPQCAVLADWDQHQPSDGWIAALKGSPSPCVRQEAAERLGEASPDDEARDALIAVAEDGTLAPALRVEATRALGHHGSAGIEALVALSKAPDVQVRMSAASALGDANAPAALTGMLARETDPQVRGRAIGALAKVDPKAALPLARKALADKKTARWERAAALGVLGEHGDDSDIDRTIAGLAPGMPKNVADAAGDALVARASDTEDEKLRGRAVTALAPLLGDSFLWARWSAANWLGDLGDARALPILDAAAADCRVPWLADEMRDAMGTIRSGEEEPGPADPDDEQRLKERLDDLERRLDRLESWR